MSDLSDSEQLDGPYPAHIPDTKDLIANYRWNLMLSGHGHGGPIRLPFIDRPFAPVKDLRYVEGLNPFDGRWIHTTRGVGNLYGVRLNCRPRVSVLHLV